MIKIKNRNFNSKYWESMQIFPKQLQKENIKQEIFPYNKYSIIIPKINSKHNIFRNNKFRFFNPLFAQLWAGIYDRKDNIYSNVIKNSSLRHLIASKKISKSLLQTMDKPSKKGINLNEKGQFMNEKECYYRSKNNIPSFASQIPRWSNKQSFILKSEAFSQIPMTKDELDEDDYSSSFKLYNKIYSINSKEINDWSKHIQSLIKRVKNITSEGLPFQNEQ